MRPVNQPSLGRLGRAYRRAVSAVAGRAMQLGLVEDESFNVMTGGDADQTFSLREAEAKKHGSPTACFVCWCLGWMVQPDHCRKTLAGGDIPWPNAIRAFIWIGFVLFGLPWLAWHAPARTAFGVAVFVGVNFAIFHLTKASGER